MLGVRYKSDSPIHVLRNSPVFCHVLNKREHWKNSGLHLAKMKYFSCMQTGKFYKNSRV